MGGKQKTNQNTTEQLTMDPRYQKQFDAGTNDLSKYFGNLLQQGITQYQAPLYSDNLDPIVQNQVSRAAQDINTQNTASQNALAQNLTRQGSGNNANLLSVLQGQGNLASAGAKNALMGPALEAQRAQDLQRQQMIASLNAQSLAANAQQFQNLAPGLSLLELLQKQGIATGKKETSTSSTTKKSWF
jgi:hypothetical protein